MITDDTHNLLKKIEELTNRLKNVETELNYLHAIIDKLPASVYWKDKRGVYLGCNQYVADMAGLFSSKSIVGKTDYDLPWKKYADELKKIDDEIISEGGEKTVEENPVLSSGEVKTFLTTKAPLQNEANEVVGIIGVSVDISEKKALEEKVSQIKASETRFKAMSSLGGMVAHEIRTPLATIGLNLSLLDKAIESLFAENQFLANQAVEKEYMKESLSDCFHAIQYANTTISTILSGFHHTVSSAGCLKKISIKKIIQETINKYPFQDGEGRLVSLNFAFDCEVLGEEGLISYVLVNLIKNALQSIKSEGRGKISISTKKVNDFVFIYIKDTVGGLEEDVKTKIFEPFYTTKKETAASIGLGLYFCKIALEKIKAKISCDTKYGKYTLFIMELPIANSD